MLRVGVTGGIGSGKSTVCRLFSDLGTYVINADDLARTIVDENDHVRQAIVAEFGPDSYLPDGQLDRKRVASVAFSNTRKRAKLNSIIHPHVFRCIEEQFASIPGSYHRGFALVEAALIFETGLDKSLSYVVVVDAEEEVRMKRVIARDNITQSEVEMRIASQMDPREKRKRAHFIIDNNGSESDLHTAVGFLDSLLSKLTRSKS